ncbi:MAG: tRNA (adenosine(37)-N6)-threonylcarbamoyltransferase complex dimerization subunit type 1 TsaB [Bdellovibrionales bacterium]|nr:tRNA (adenosine(37)-N6)-threonylcarbamoyltransferase complex dimerization subunit type 1 TsaB [Bdellovibrionales bacterium]
MKLVLIAETSSPSGGLSLLECSDKYLDAVVRDCQQWQRESSHSEVVTGAVRILLERNALHLSEISLFGVGVGPGSFTGIRVGINMMRAFAYSFQTPLFGYSSLEALALSTHRQDLPIVCLVNAFGNMIYGASYAWTATGSLRELASPRALGLDQVSQLFDGPSLVVGNAYDTYQRFFPHGLLNLMLRETHQPDEPQVQFFSPRLDLRARQEVKNDWKSVKPLYIRASEAEEKLKKGLLKPLPKI